MQRRWRLVKFKPTERGVARALAVIPNRQISGALLVRRNGWEQSLDARSGRVLKATNAITTLRLRMAALELGLQQLNQVLPSSDGDTPEEDA
jgi:hypothetical protein